MKILIFILSLLSLLSCNEEEVIDGYIIDYNVTTNTKSGEETISSDERMYLANGLYKREIYGGISLYNYKDNLLRDKQDGSDTVAVHNVKINVTNFVRQNFEVSERKIMGELCVCSSIEAETSNVEYCYSKQMKLDVDKFSQHKYLFLSNIYSESRSPYLYLKITGGSNFIEWTAKKCVKSKIPLSKFTMDKSLPTRPFNL